MLSKHKNSKLNTGLGITLSTVLCVFALTKAPTLIAADNPQLEKPITMSFNEVRAGKIISLISDFSDINIHAPKIIQDKVITITLTNIPILKALEMLSRCNSHDIDIKDDTIYFVSSDLPTPDYCGNKDGNTTITNETSI